MFPEPSPGSASVMTPSSQTDEHLSKLSPEGATPKMCAGCGGPILDRWLLCVSDRYWHTNCLRCSACSGMLGELGQSCFAKQGRLFCKKDYIRMFGPHGQCAACRQEIPPSELVIKSQGVVYHPTCLTCGSCRAQLSTGDKYGIVNGMVFCERDYPKAAQQFAETSGQKLTSRGSQKVC